MPELSTNEFRDLFRSLGDIGVSDDYVQVLRDFNFGYNGTFYCFSLNQTKLYFLNNAIFWDVKQVKFQIKDNG